MTDPEPSLSPFLEAELTRTRAMAQRANLLLEQLLDARGELQVAIRRVSERGLSGHEAAAAGAVLALRRRTDGTGDVFSPTVRTLSACLSMGLAPEELFRQALGRRGSPDEGRAPPLHLHDLRRGIVGPIRPPGTALEVLAGLTLAFRARSQDRVGVVFAGEGAPASGAWHEGFNLAAVRRCPLVVLIDARSPAGDPMARSLALEDLCEAYGVRGHRVDRSGAGAVFRATRNAIALARAGGGVQVVEYPRTTPESDALEDRMKRWTGEADTRLGAALEAALLGDAPDPDAAMAPVRTDHAPARPWYRGRLDSDSERVHADGRRASRTVPTPGVRT